MRIHYITAGPVISQLNFFFFLQRISVQMYVYKFPLQTISYFTTNRLRDRYSILVKQIVLTKDWYEWKQQLQKNTEQLGSIFDAQPSQTGGNIVCTTDTTAKVIGFVGCTSEIEKRIFISRAQIPEVAVYTGYETCVADTVDFGSYSIFANGSAYIISLAVRPGGVEVGYLGCQQGMHAMFGTRRNASQTGFLVNITSPARVLYYTSLYNPAVKDR